MLAADERSWQRWRSNKKIFVVLCTEHAPSQATPLTPMETARYVAWRAEYFVKLFDETPRQFGKIGRPKGSGLGYPEVAEELKKTVEWVRDQVLLTGLAEREKIPRGPDCGSVRRIRMRLEANGEIALSGERVGKDGKRYVKPAGATNVAPVEEAVSAPSEAELLKKDQWMFRLDMLGWAHEDIASVFGIERRAIDNVITGRDYHGSFSDFRISTIQSLREGKSVKQVAEDRNVPEVSVADDLGVRVKTADQSGVKDL